MKHKILSILCLLALLLPVTAIAADGSGLRGDALKAYISIPDNKVAYIKMLNERVSQSEECKKYGVVVTDVKVYKDSTRVKLLAAAKSMSAESKSGLNNGHDSLTASYNDAMGLIDYHVTYTYDYYSVNGKNETVKVSGIIYVESDTPDAIELGILNCHPTVSDNKEAPSGSEPIDEVIHAMCDENCLVFCPDYCGYGTSSDQQHPYLIQDVTARNCIDGYLAALTYAKEVLGFSFSSNFYSLFTGYSQGGSVALACQKYYETKMSSADKTTMNLKHSFCGDGPYSPLTTMNKYMEWANNGETFSYPSVLPLIVMGAKDAYDKDCMHTVKMEDCFVSDFLTKTGCVDMLNKKEATMTEINQVIFNNGFTTIDQMLSDKILTVTYDANGNKTIALNTTSNEGKCLVRALAMNDMTTGWTPSIPITFMHFDNDKVVPYANYELIQSKVNDGEWSSDKIKFVTAVEAYNCKGYFSTFHLIVNALVDGDTSKWDHSSVGTLFYVWLLFGTARDNL